ncbi:recombination protein RecR [bacterium]|nr:recombination protein RecR [bacterium]
MLPKAVRSVTEELTKLPGIGPRTAERLTLHLLRQPNNLVARLADTLKDLHENVQTCRTCFNLAESTTCAVCGSEMRDRSLVCVVEDALDVEAIEKTNAYNGLYHVLGGVLSPVEGVGPQQLTMQQLLDRVKQKEVSELIIALDHKMESDATTRHIMGKLEGSGVIISRLARGLPTGGDIEFADALTISASLEGRRKL